MELVVTHPSYRFELYHGAVLITRLALPQFWLCVLILEQPFPWSKGIAFDFPQIHELAVVKVYPLPNDTFVDTTEANYFLVEGAIPALGELCFAEFMNVRSGLSSVGRLIKPK